MDQEAQLDELEAALGGLDLALECVDDELNGPADVEDGELLVREDRLEL